MTLKLSNKYKLEKIGTIDQGMDGQEVYYTIDVDYPEVIDLDQATFICKNYFCYESRNPGGKFCDTVHITHAKYSKSSGLVIVFERYDN